MNGTEGFSGECTELFSDGELLGDLRTVEVNSGFTEIVYAPVPPVDD